MHVRFPSFALLLVPLLSGCYGDAPASFCEDAYAGDTVQAVHGTDIAIDGGELILHAADASIELREAGGCRAITAADVRIGDLLAHDANAIAESYPAQAWPDHVVVVR